MAKAILRAGEAEVKSPVKQVPVHPQLADALQVFSRDNRWGTCGDCPRDGSGRKVPELCENTLRYDHNLTIDSLRDAVVRWQKAVEATQ